jgi:hypothetical protein
VSAAWAAAAVAGVSALIAIVAAVGTAGQWREAKRANQQAQRAHEQAQELLTLEKARRRDDLTPQFDLAVEAAGDVLGGPMELRVKLMGPDGLGQLDQVAITIRDDRPRGPSSTTGGPSAEDIARQVWGPWRFRPAVDGADKLGRSLAPFSLGVGEQRSFLLEETSPPPWSAESLDQWQTTYQFSALPLTLTCELDGHEPWILRREARPPWM